MKRVNKVEIGQRFEAIGAVRGMPTFGYEVQAVFRSAIDHIDYARLVQLGDPTRTKTISVLALLDPRHFAPLAAEEGAPPPAERRDAQRAALGSAR
jgi:hypothetical protein